MLAFGRAPMAEPRIMAFDEPSLGLAPLVVREIFALLETINRVDGVTIVLAEQNATLPLAARTALSNCRRNGARIYHWRRTRPRSRGVSAPERGDIVVMDFDPQTGHEQTKRRPALVVSPASFNATFGLAFVAPITTKPRGHAFEVLLPKDGSVKGVIMMHQLKSLDWRTRRAKITARVPSSVLAEAVEIIKDILID